VRSPPSGGVKGEESLHSLATFPVPHPLDAKEPRPEGAARALSRSWLQVAEEGGRVTERQVAPHVNPILPQGSPPRPGYPIPPAGCRRQRSLPWGEKKQKWATGSGQASEALPGALRCRSETPPPSHRCLQAASFPSRTYGTLCRVVRPNEHAPAPAPFRITLGMDFRALRARTAGVRRTVLRCPKRCRPSPLGGMSRTRDRGTRLWGVGGSGGGDLQTVGRSHLPRQCPAAGRPIPGLS
jgi:hypothetical protein